MQQRIECSLAHAPPHTFQITIFSYLCRWNLPRVSGMMSWRSHLLFFIETLDLRIDHDLGVDGKGHKGLVILVDSSQPSFHHVWLIGTEIPHTSTDLHASMRQSSRSEKAAISKRKRETKNAWERWSCVRYTHAKCIPSWWWQRQTSCQLASRQSMHQEDKFVRFLWNSARG